ncbi:hypothetical protein [Proteus terrae]|uniref:hypothetical protein n=1 Tax=Proteus terrae TaxID=1574161 RepID=UPI00301C6835
MSIKYNRVELHVAFQDGNLNSSEFKDLKNFSDEEIRLLTTFISNVTNEKSLVGKNKPSWLNDNGEKIADTDAYEDGNYWHYHCGPYNESARIQAVTFNLNFNPLGLTSNAVIHYQKENDGKILIVGFSPTHLPFPKSDDPHENPLFENIDSDD